MTFGAPVVFRDADRRSRLVIRVHPISQSRDQHDLVIDPRGIGVIRVPQRTRRSITQQLHRCARIIAEFSALGIVMDGEDVQKMPSVELDLIQQPRQIVGAPVVGTIGQEAPSVLTAILLIVAAIEVPAPAPLFRPYDLCVGIGGSNLDSIVRWTSQCTANAARDEQFVELAARSGCKALFLGLESISQESL